MTTVIFLIVLNIVVFSALGAVTEINREKLNAMHKELRKFTYIADEIQKNPAKVQAGFHKAFDTIDAHLSQAASHQFPRTGQPPFRRRVGGPRFPDRGPIGLAPQVGDDKFFGPDPTEALNADDK